MSNQAHENRSNTLRSLTTTSPTTNDTHHLNSKKDVRWTDIVKRHSPVTPKTANDVSKAVAQAVAQKDKDAMRYSRIMPFVKQFPNPNKIVAQWPGLNRKGQAK